ncbi:hypothetical protein BM613_12990 [Sulfoacidibacillus thermotolerans]|uniref:Uncharacterized protein n=2 Tax=Sulfoacidibacillus thermotolerans TaxID=1765684 RepID=A0A2U3D5M5_SULT2|nr:hypothetical protein BM613_12990 [Sulfoacidibacillus thermotolerans]
MAIKCTHPDNYDQESINYKGLVVNVKSLDPISKRAEGGKIHQGIPFYYYYDEATWQFVRDKQIPTAKVRNMCRKCLKKSLSTDEPHYGDGVYMTLHSDLYNANTTTEVLKSHGIGKRSFKATYMCCSAETFRKIPCTGGVVRSVVHQVNQVGRLAMNPESVIQMSDGR